MIFLTIAVFLSAWDLCTAHDMDWHMYWSVWWRHGGLQIHREAL